MFAPRRDCLPFVILLACTLPLAASQRWISVTTSHFEMYTTNSETQAMEALQGFEQVRYFFLQSSKGKQTPEARVRIIAFSSERDYKPYRPNAGTFAYYLRTRERDYIVMQDISPEHHQAAFHEYTHLVVQHMQLDLPVWLNEGLADVYSSLEPRGQQAMVGRPLAGRLMFLSDHALIDWNVLFGVDRNSPYYNERDKMSVFYAQSWALTHMLALGGDYSRGFSKFLSTVAAGTPAQEALQKVYGKNLKQVSDDFQQYMRRSTVSAAVFDVTLQKSDLDPQVASLSEFQTTLAFADLLASRKETVAEAETNLLALVRQNPQSPAVEESLGYLAWQQGKLPEARKHFGLAVKLGSKNAGMIYQYAELEQSGGAPFEDVIELLKQVVALQPDNDEARIFLAGVATSQRQYGFAFSTISAVHTIKPEQAFEYFTISAYCRANLKDLEGAREYARKALPYAKTPSERMQIDNLTNELDGVKTNTATSASGTVVQ